MADFTTLDIHTPSFPNKPGIFYTAQERCKNFPQVGKWWPTPKAAPVLRQLRSHGTAPPDCFDVLEAASQ